MRQIIVLAIVTLSALLSFRHPEAYVVRGKITDLTGNAISNVRVLEKGTRNSTLTDASGNFTLSVRSENAKLIFKAPGYNEEEVKVNGEKLLTIQLTSTSRPEEQLMKIGGRDKSEAVSRLSVTSSARRSAPYKSQGYNNAVPYQRGTMNAPAIDNTRNASPARQKEAWDTTSDFNTEDYDAIVENRFLSVKDNTLSTFSIDVDAASYSNIRRYLQMKQLPPAGSVRIEEMINYFHYEYPKPLHDAPFSINTEMSACPWNNDHRLVLIGLQGKKIASTNLPASNIVFLIDVSGSMEDENKLPLVKASMKLLVDQLREQDKVSIVVYAGNAGLVLPSTSGAEKIRIKDAIDKLEAGGSTAGGEGIRLAYATAKNNFLKAGNNRVVLCTDGDFNVGVSSDAELETMITEERKSGVFLTVLGFGMGNYKDNKMQKLADKGNGNHAYIDGLSEAKKVLVNEFGGTLFTIAKDVKLQIEFNPARVQAYRLIGYENRMLNKEDFNNDKKDAGELGSGHTVTALYEIIPQGVPNEFLEKVDPLRYGKPNDPVTPFVTNREELMNIKFRYKDPAAETSKLIEHPVVDKQTALANTSSNFRFAASVVEFGMLLRNSEFKQASSYENARKLAREALGNDEEGYRGEFLQLLTVAQSLVAR